MNYRYTKLFSIGVFTFVLSLPIACGSISIVDDINDAGGLDVQLDSKVPPDHKAPNDALTDTDAAGGSGGSAGQDAGADAGGKGGQEAGGSGGSDAGGDGGQEAGGSDAGGEGGQETGGAGGSTGGTGGAGGTGGSAGETGGAGGSGGSVEPFSLRIVAANITSGNFQSYDPGHGKRILQGLKGDIVLIQEFNYGSNSHSDLQDFVTDVCGATCSYSRGEGRIPNGIISRYPIIDSGSWKDPRVGDRDFAWAHIDLPGPKDLWAISVHLLTASANERNLEAKEIVGRMGSIPNDDLITLGGDFNTDSRTESCLSTFRARFTVEAPYPADHKGNGNTNLKRSKPYDWVLASPSLNAMEVPLVIGESTYAKGLVFDSRVYEPLSEVEPVLVGDSSSSNMQHMAVARDFLIQ